jgi:malate dehydrogenase (oxaloacetate-decarboxylating)
MNEDFAARSLVIHEQLRGKIEVSAKLPLETREDLSTAYTPGIAAPCQAIAKDPRRARDLTIKRNTVAVVTDGSAVLGLGNIGPLAALPVMEGKALLFKKYADIDAWPICLDTQDTNEIVETVRRIAPGFGGINLEDISAPRCFEVEERLQDLGIPVFHDDQHGTAIVLLAAMLNAAKVVDKDFTNLTVVINGAGAAGTAIASLLRGVGVESSNYMPVKDAIVCDSKGVIHRGRTDLNPEKTALLEYTNRENRSGSIHDAIVDTDVFVGVSVANLLTPDDVRSMAPDPVILALANPDPEILPDQAKAGGAAVVGTGRSDFPTHVNNVLAFPGIFRGALDAGVPRITPAMKMAAAIALADSVQDLSADKILPSPLNKAIAPLVARAVRLAAV